MESQRKLLFAIREKLQESKNFFLQRNLAQENLGVLEHEIQNKNQVCSDLLHKLAEQKQKKLSLERNVEESLKKYSDSEEGNREVLVNEISEFESQFMQAKIQLEK